MIVLHTRPDRDILALPFKHRGAVGQFHAALPFLHNARVARRGGRARPEIRRNIQGITIAPRDLLLRLRQREAVRDELLLLQIEFAHHIGIGAAARERDETPVVRRFEHVLPVPHPVVLFLGRERIHIYHRLPLRAFLAILLQRRSPPDAAHVLLVAPEVVVIRAVFSYGRNAILRIEDRQQPCAHRCVIRIALKRLGRHRVLRAHPVQCPRCRHIFKPEIRILRNPSPRESWHHHRKRRPSWSSPQPARQRRPISLLF